VGPDEVADAGSGSDHALDADIASDLRVRSPAQGEPAVDVGSLDRIKQLEDARRVHAGHADYTWMAYVGHERDGAWYLLTAWQGD
jgi:hypothetical protein